MLTVMTYLWFDEFWQHNDVFQYGPDDVRALKDKVKEHMPIPHEFAVVTDRVEWFDRDKDIRAIKIDKTTHVPGRCYVRLFTFHPSGKEIFGERVLQLDLDSIPVGNMAPLVDRDEDLVLWQNPTRKPWRDGGKFKGRAIYNTSMLLHRCGTRPAVFTEFDTIQTPKYHKDDQWYLSAIFGFDAPHWTDADGVYRLAREDTPGSGIEGDLPDNARIVFFPGEKGKPWLPEVQARCPWIKEHRQ